MNSRFCRNYARRDNVMVSGEMIERIVKVIKMYQYRKFSGSGSSGSGGEQSLVLLYYYRIIVCMCVV